MLLRKELKSIAKLTTNEECRYALSNILLEENGGFPKLSVTDGHLCLVVEYEDPLPDDLYPSIPALEEASNSGSRVLVPADQWCEIFKGLKNNKTLPQLENVAVKLGEDGAVFAHTDGLAKGQVSVTQVAGSEARFPDVPRVIPRGKGDVSVCLNIYLLKRLIDTLIGILPSSASKEQVPVRFDIFPNGKDVYKPVRLVMAGDKDTPYHCRAALMPMRGSVREMPINHATEEPPVEEPRVEEPPAVVSESKTNEAKAKELMNVLATEKRPVEEPPEVEDATEQQIGESVLDGEPQTDPKLDHEAMNEQIPREVAEAGLTLSQLTALTA